MVDFFVKLIMSSASQEIRRIFFGKRSFGYGVQNNPPLVRISGLQNAVQFNITLPSIWGGEEAWGSVVVKALRY